MAKEKEKGRCMLKRGRFATIAVFGHFGNRNLGDEAIVTAVIQNIRLRVPSAKVIGFSLKPDDTARRYGIPAFPIRYIAQTGVEQATELSERERAGDKRGAKRPLTIVEIARDSVEKTKTFIKRLPLGQKAISTARALANLVPSVVNEIRFLGRSYKVLKEVDVLIVSGSNQLMDSFGGCNEGPKGFPYTLLKWTVLAKLAGSNVVYLSVGAGPISARLSKAMIWLALQLSDYISFRDLRSQQLVADLGIKDAGGVFPDLAYSLCAASEKSAGNRQSEEKPTVGINPMPVFDKEYWYVHDADRYACYVANLATFSSTLLREGYPLVFWGTQPKDEGVINDILASVEAQLDRAVNARELIETASSVDELLDIVGSLDIAVATRFHGVVLSLCTGTAVISLCYHKKMHDVMNEMGQSGYSIMLDELEAENLLKTFKRLELNRDRESEKIRRKAAEYRRALARQYDSLLGSPGPVQEG